MVKKIATYTIIGAAILGGWSFDRVQSNNTCSQQMTDYFNDLARPLITQDQKTQRIWESMILHTNQDDYPRTWLGTSQQFSRVVAKYQKLQLLPFKVIDELVEMTEQESKKWKACP